MRLHWYIEAKPEGRQNDFVASQTVKEQVRINFRGAQDKRVGLFQRFGIKRTQGVLRRLLEPDVMSLNGQGRGDALMAILGYRCPRACRPVVNSLFLAFETTLEKMAIFSQVVQQARHVRFLFSAERLSMQGSARSHISQMLFKRLRCSSQNSRAVRIVLGCHKGLVLAGPYLGYHAAT